MVPLAVCRKRQGNLPAFCGNGQGPFHRDFLACSSGSAAGIGAEVAAAAEDPRRVRATPRRTRSRTPSRTSSPRERGFDLSVKVMSEAEYVERRATRFLANAQAEGVALA
jgi:hypothetical protein